MKTRKNKSNDSKQKSSKGSAKNIYKESIYNNYVTWSLKHYDNTAPWPSSEKDDTDIKSLLYSLRGKEQLTLGELFKENGGRNRGTNNHYISISDMSKEAIKQAVKINITEDELFSLRLGSRLRLFGIIKDSVFFIIWYDPHHEVYPLNK